MSPWRAGYEIGLEQATQERQGYRLRWCKTCGQNRYHFERQCQLCPPRKTERKAHE